jgi:hypothetical protein
VQDFVTYNCAQRTKGAWAVVTPDAPAKYLEALVVAGGLSVIVTASPWELEEQSEENQWNPGVRYNPARASVWMWANWKPGVVLTNSEEVARDARRAFAKVWEVVVVDPSELPQ